MGKIKIRFVGIDSWNRPIFKSANDEYYGSTDVLFDYSAKEAEVLEALGDEQIEYFGNHFDCEPLGQGGYSLEIVKNEDWDEN